LDYDASHGSAEAPKYFVNVVSHILIEGLNAGCFVHWLIGRVSQFFSFRRESNPIFFGLKWISFARNLHQTLLMGALLSSQCNLKINLLICSNQREKIACN
jgi:hypothetical protein